MGRGGSVGVGRVGQTRTCDHFAATHSFFLNSSRVTSSLHKSLAERPSTSRVVIVEITMLAEWYSQLA